MSNKSKELSVYSWATHGDGALFAYKQGYRKAIKILLQQVCVNETSYVDDLLKNSGLIYPLMFLSRRYVEIELRHVITMCCLLGFLCNVKSGHKLGLLWNEVMNCVENSQGVDYRKEFENNVGSIIIFFSSVLIPAATVFAIQRPFMRNHDGRSRLVLM